MSEAMVDFVLSALELEKPRGKHTTAYPSTGDAKYSHNGAEYYLACLFRLKANEEVV